MRRRLFLVTLAVTTVLVAAFAFPLAVLIREVARDRAITEAEQGLASLAPTLAVSTDPASIETAIASVPGQEGRVSVLPPDGTRIGDTTPANQDAVALARDRKQAFSQTTDDGVDVFTPVVVSTDDVFVLRARVPAADITEGVTDAWAVLAGVALLLIAASVAVTDRLARSVTRPAADLARTSRDLAGGDTTARAVVTGPPEIAAVAESLNLLADRIDELLTAERERVADLSHRLRTPLTALRLDAEGHGAAALVEDVDRLEAEVTELIRAARRPLHETVTVRCDLARVVADRASFWGALADDDGRRWTSTVEPDGPHLVRLSAADAEAAVDVLLGNVFAHTPEGAPYALCVTAADGRVCLLVEDGGPGIADSHLLLDRGASTGGSTGLGLDIAASAARAAGGELRVDTSETLGGARVVLDLPRAEDTPVTPVDAAVRAEIQRRGPIPFSEVVERALYAPDGGFYASGGRAGRRGDFLTSPEVGPLFGVVVARALDAWWDEAGRPAVFPVVEAGAGPGTLARAVLAAEPRCAPALRYVLVERSAAQRDLHAEHLALEPPGSAFASLPDPDDDDTRAVGPPPTGPILVSLPELPRLPGPCVVLANELLDNLPFGLLERTAAGWAEVHVGLDGDDLVEVPLPTADGVDVDAAIGARTPRQSAAAGWVADARALAGREGRVVALDYASTTADLAQRPWTEWVRTYRGHARGGAPLEGLGTQDITCEVAVDQLPAPATASSQADWLRAHGIDDLVAQGRAEWEERAAVGDLAAVRARSRVGEAAALLDEGGLGAFRVLEWRG